MRPPGLVMFFLAAALTAAPALAADFHVATDGNDAWSGRLAAPDAAKQDGPFATLERARDAVRKLKGGKPAAEPITVHVRAGTYSLAQTLKLGPEDSGVVWRGYREERPTVIGGRQIAGFAPHKGEVLISDLAAQGWKNPAFRQLVFDGRRQYLARYPNHDPEHPYTGGWAYVDGEPVPMYKDDPGDNRRLLVQKAADLRSWARPEDGEVCVFARYNWWNNILGIAAVDREKRAITLKGDASYAIRPGDRYYVSGLLEELDAPGEWYLDRADGKLYFWPPAPLAGKIVVAPTMRAIIEIGRGAEHITFRGFTLECCEGTAVVLKEARDCLIAGNVIRNAGDYHGSGVQVAGGLRNGVVGNDIYEIGSHAISLDGGDRKTLAAAGNYADNNYLHHFGVYYKQGVGVDLRGVGNRASHNLIHDGPRMGIMFSGNNLVIEYNHIRHVNLETEDTGAVYTGGRDWISSRGTVIRHNYFHDILGFGQRDGKWVTPFFAWGVYLDDNTGGVDVIGNIVVRASRAGLHLHSARDNLVENNVFVDNGLHQAEYSGWTGTSRMWLDHFPTMVKGFESVANEPAWAGMRNMKLHPKDAVLPNGLVMTGNVLRRNIFCYRGEKATLYRFGNVPFDRNETDLNLVWHHGRPLLTGQVGCGQELSGNLLQNPGFEDGKPGEMPKSWSWQARPSPECKAGVAGDVAAEGRQSLRLDAVPVKDAKCNPPWPVVVGAELPAKPGQAFRLRARFRAEKPDTGLELGIQSYLANVYYWGRSAPVAAGPEWKEVELTFRLPAAGEPGYNEKMQAIRARIDFRSSAGTAWVDDVSLKEVEALDEWKSLQALGFDRNSLVADPLFVDADKDDYRLKPDSPALKLGFQPIPVEKIGPYRDTLRASWPIVEAVGAREKSSVTPAAAPRK
jgi:parallel beta-helix repeat protein